MFLCPTSAQPSVTHNLAVATVHNSGSKSSVSSGEMTEFPWMAALSGRMLPRIDN